MHNQQYKYRWVKYPIPKFQNGSPGKFKQWAAKHEKALAGVATGLSKVNSAARGLDEQQSAINSGLTSVISSLGPTGAAVAAGLQVFDGMGAALGAKIDVVDSDAASRAGIGGANNANKMLASLPGVGTIAGAFAKKTDTSYKSADIDEMSSAFGGSVNNINAAQKMGGKKMLFGRKKANKFIQQQNRVNRLVTDISTDAKKAKQNSVGETLLNQSMNLYSGYSPQLLLSKKGMKFPELKEARNIIKSLSPKSTNTQELQKFQLGGKMNIIPDGSRHSRKHNLEETKPELKDKITKKGIPVISKDENGEIIQCAEIEKDEWTLRKEFTDKIESLYKQYIENPSDEIAIEAGKLICYELLKNTDDRSGLIKSIK